MAVAAARTLLLLGVALAAAEEHGWPEFDPSDLDYEDDSKGVCFHLKLPQETPVPTCCKGWEEVKDAASAAPAGADADSELPQCRPVCEPACVNATCAEPNVCKCLPNYARKHDAPKHVCEPRCTQVCVNAACVGPNTCLCNEGFEPTSSRNVCQKTRSSSGGGGGGSGVLGPSPPASWGLCRPPCKEFQTCVDRTCTCAEGYAPDPRQPDTCIPACKPPCGPHAYCMANGACQCITGYTEAAKGECVPVCDGGCVNGRCVAPGECRCYEGFEKFVEDGDELCVPQCKPPCGPGGDCIALNICSCDSGHTLSEDGDCIGICPEGTTWNRTLQLCKNTSTPYPTAPTTTPTRHQTTPSPTPTPPPTPPPPPPPPPPSERPSTEVPVPTSQPCASPCVHGRCVRTGTCECLRGWTGADCARPCELRAGGLQFDASGCPELVNCTCSQPAPDGRSCLPGESVRTRSECGLRAGGGDLAGRWAVVQVVVVGGRRRCGAGPAALRGPSVRSGPAATPQEPTQRKPRQGDATRIYTR